MIGLGLAYLLVSPAHADFPQGAEIQDAVHVDITEEGFEDISNLLPAFIPTDINVPDLFESDCAVDFLGCVVGWEFSIENIDVDFEMDELELNPGTNVIYLDAEAKIGLNSPGAPMMAEATGDILWGLISISTGTCDIWVDPISVFVDTIVNVELVTTSDGKVIDVYVNEITPSVDTTGVQYDISNCWIGTLQDILDFILGLFGTSVLDIALDIAMPIITNQINALRPEIEALVEDALAQARLEQEVDLLGTSMEVRAVPDALSITQEGLRMTLVGAADTGPEPHPCVAPWASTALSLETLSDPPRMGRGPSAFGTQVAVYLNDDYVNSILHSAWYGGLLCFTIDENFEEIPIPIDTALLNLLSDNAFEPFFPEASTMTIITRPETAPVLETEGRNDLNVAVETLGLDMYAELDGRLIRVVGIDMEVKAGFDVDFDDESGFLNLGLDFDPRRLNTDVVFNELDPDASRKFERAFSDLFETVATPLVDSLAESLGFQLPAFEALGSGQAIGLRSALVEAAGSSDDYVGMFVSVGEVDYPAGGCGGEEGCGGGCEGGGCSNGLPSPLAVVIIPGLIGILRRRRAA